MTLRYFLLTFTISFFSLFGNQESFKSHHLNLSKGLSFFKSDITIFPDCWCLSLKDIPSDRGILTLKQSTALWEQTCWGKEELFLTTKEK